ncbi:MAG: hypothetical protein CTY19_08740 [Methylomonas sp.]|nr:MAG: hypothetical protein CTY19_08740 [Methylomonas sp.]
MIRLATFALLGVGLSSAVLADSDWHDDYHGHRRHHHRHHHDHYPRYRVERIYVPERVVEYVPVQPRYYAPPPPPINYYRYDQRSTQGLVGGMAGSAIGYEIGRGDPLAAGIGAAAGALLGNGFY